MSSNIIFARPRHEYKLDIEGYNKWVNDPALISPLFQADDRFYIMTEHENTLYSLQDMMGEPICHIHSVNRPVGCYVPVRLVSVVNG